jgi:hypothetical protein
VPLFYQYFFAVSLAIAIACFFVALNFFIMKRRLKIASSLFTQSEYRLNLCDNSVSIKGLYLGRPVEIKIISYFRAPFSVVITCSGGFPVNEFHLYKDRKGDIKYFQKLTTEFIPKEVINAEQKSLLDAFYQKNADIFARILDCGITRVSIYPDRALLFSHSSFSTKKQKALLRDTFILKKVINLAYSLIPR